HDSIGKRDFRHHHHRLPPDPERPLRKPQIDFGLAAPGHTPHQRRLEGAIRDPRGYRVDRGLLLGHKLMDRAEAVGVEGDTYWLKRGKAAPAQYAQRDLRSGKARFDLLLCDTRISNFDQDAHDLALALAAQIREV